MRQSGRCVKCGCADILRRVRVVGLDGYDLLLRVDGNPSAMMFKHSGHSPMDAYVCADCGFTELYARVPKNLQGPSLEAQGGSEKAK